MTKYCNSKFQKQFIKFPTYLPSPAFFASNPTLTETQIQEMTLIRETLELAVLLFSKPDNLDLEQFDSHFAQLRCYYAINQKFSFPFSNKTTNTKFSQFIFLLKLMNNSSKSPILPASLREPLILALNLLRLLSDNKKKEFAFELELIPFEKRESEIFIKNVVNLEQYLTEGRYNKFKYEELKSQLPDVFEPFEKFFFKDVLFKPTNFWFFFFEDFSIC